MRSSETLTQKLNDSFSELGISSQQQQSLELYLNLIRNRSEETWQHSVGVGITAKEIAQYTHIMDPKALFYPGLLHDVGKSLTNPESLDKKEGFNGDDVKELSKHPVDSYRILRGIHDFSARVAAMHHTFQGKRSYPKKLPPQELEVSTQTEALVIYCARLISLTDFYDAATFRENDRYSPGKPRLLTNEEVKTDLIKCNQDQEYLINNLYASKIFGRKD